MAADLDRDLAELLAERARLEAENVPHPKFAAAVQQQMAGARMDYMAKCAEFIFTHGTALAALRAEAGAVDYPAEFVRTMQQAVESVTVPKMSPLKQELFKAGCVATINAINAALAQARRTDRAPD